MKQIVIRAVIYAVIVGIVTAVIFIVGVSASACTEFEYTEDEVDILAGLISAEARGESYEGKLAVGTVVMNRVDSGIWGSSIQSVVYAKNQFAKPLDRYDDECLNAAIEVLNGHRSFPENVLYFQVKRVDKWRNAIWHCKIGAHNFYGMCRKTT